MPDNTYESMEKGIETMPNGRVNWWYHHEVDGQVIAEYDDESDTLEEAARALEDAEQETKQLEDGKS